MSFSDLHKVNICHSIALLKVAFHVMQAQFYDTRSCIWTKLGGIVHPYEGNVHAKFEVRGVTGILWSPAKFGETPLVPHTLNLA